MKTSGESAILNAPIKASVYLNLNYSFCSLLSFLINDNVTRVLSKNKVVHLKIGTESEIQKIDQKKCQLNILLIQNFVVWIKPPFKSDFQVVGTLVKKLITWLS